MIQIESNSVERTIELGRRIGGLLGAGNGGQVIALIGQLGVGKTHLVKGIALGLDAAPDEVNSPTFTLINEYDGRLPLYHIDAYRLERPEQLAQLGLDELCEPPNLVLVEWADLVWDAVTPHQPIRIELTHQSPTERRLVIERASRGWQKVLATN